MNLSSTNDVLNTIQETSDGSFILAANVKSTPDVGLVKLDANGNLLWCITFGNVGHYDESTSILELQDGNYLLTGKYISMGTFNAFLLKTHTSGNLLWLKCFGDTLQHATGCDIKMLNNGDILMVGSTILAKANYRSYGDNFIFKLNSQGDTIRTWIFYGTPDLFENATSIAFDTAGNYVLGMATVSYHSIGFVPNKMGLVTFSPNGNLLQAKLYNTGSSHYTRISNTPYNGLLMSGFSTNYSGPVGFRSLLIKMNSQWQSGCYDQDVTASTQTTSVQLKITCPTPVIASGGNSNQNASTIF